MEKNFLEYASYVIMDRAIPDLRDGCKPVQRRILHTLFEMHDGKFHKVANVIGECMKLHPHGDASIGDALVVLANKEYFIEKQGNFGNILTGHAAAASRYTECRLTPLAVETLFNKALTEYIPSYDGRRQEPRELPAKVPVLLMLGRGRHRGGNVHHHPPAQFHRAAGGADRHPRGNDYTLAPDFIQGGLIDVSEYDDGRGKIRVRARIEKVAARRSSSSATSPSPPPPPSLIASIEAAVQKGKVSVSTISDFTTDKVEIELHLSRGATAEAVMDQLYAHTDCEVSISSNIVVIRNDRPVEITVSEYLKEFTGILKKQIKAELEHELANLENRRHWLTLEQIFIENRVYKAIEKATTEEAVKRQVFEGMKPFKKLFVRAMTDDDVTRLLDLRIRRISAYDIKKNRGEIDDIVAAIRQCNAKLKNLTKTTIGWLVGPHREVPGPLPPADGHRDLPHGGQGGGCQGEHPAELRPGGRLLRLLHARLGVRDERHGVRPHPHGDRGRHLPHHGAPGKGVDAGRAPVRRGLGSRRRASISSWSTGTRNKVAWGKRVHIERFITNKTYSLVKEGSVGHRLPVGEEEPGRAAAQHGAVQAPEGEGGHRGPGQDPACGLTARGLKLSTKPVESVELLPGKEKPARSGKEVGAEAAFAPTSLRGGCPAAAADGVCRTRSFSERLNAILGACSSGLALRVILSPVAGLIPTRAFRAGRLLRDSRPIFPSGTRSPSRRPDSSMMW